MHTHHTPTPYMHTCTRTHTHTLTHTHNTHTHTHTHLGFASCTHFMKNIVPYIYHTDMYCNKAYKYSTKHARTHTCTLASLSLFAMVLFTLLKGSSENGAPPALICRATLPTPLDWATPIPPSTTSGCTTGISE